VSPERNIEPSVSWVLTRTFPNHRRQSYGGTAAFNGSVGEKARADARIILEGIKSTTTQSRTSQSNDVVWHSLVNSDTKTDILMLPRRDP
jgi:hypothetical protein